MTGSMVRGEGSRSGVSEMRGWVRVSKGVSSIIGYHGIIVISYLRPPSDYQPELPNFELQTGIIVTISINQKVHALCLRLIGLIKPI